MSAGPAYVLAVAALCMSGAAVQAQERAADKQLPKAAVKAPPPQQGAWKWKPADKQSLKGDPVPAHQAAKKVSPGTTQSLNPQPLPPREAGTMQR